MKSIQLAKDLKSNDIKVYQSYNKQIGSFDISKLSEAFSWNGEKVIEYFLDVLTDCNYHTERKQIETTLKTLKDEY